MIKSREPQRPQKDASETNEPILLTEKEVAKLLGFAPKTLQGWRARGHVKLPFVRVSRGCVRYVRSEIDAWIEGQLRTSTSDDAARGLILRERKTDRSKPA